MKEGLESRERTARHVERAAAVLILVTALAYAGRFVGTMAGSSLWNDELHTILHFSGRGPWTVLTDYTVPNNHIFFNLLCSLLPGRESVDPLRARIVSMTAVTALLALGFGVFARRGAILCGALFVQLLAVNWELLDLSLQARGYGLALVLAFLASWGACLVLEARPGGLLLMTAAVVLGTWTLPVFMLFGAPLLLFCLFFSAERPRILRAILAAAIAVVALHAPLLPSFVTSLRTYGREYGRAYASAGAIADTVRTYLLGTPLPGMRASRAMAFVVLAGLVLLGWAAGRRRAAFAPLAWTLFGSAGAFLLACVVAGTPPIRATSLVAAPLAFGASLAVESLLRGVSRGWILAAPALLLGVLLGAANLVGAFGLVYVPMEEWKGAADFLRRRERRTDVVVLFRKEFLEMHRPGARLLDPPIPAGSFAAGRVAVLDNVVDPAPRFDGRAFSPDSVEVRFPQRRNGWSSLWFVPAR